MYMQPLFEVIFGRLFIRAAVAEPRRGEGRPTLGPLGQAAMVVGVVEVPVTIDVERMHAARLNDALWIDISQSHVPQDYSGDALRALGESQIGDVLRSASFRRSVLPDTLDVFVRDTHLPRESTGRKWVYVAGAIAERPRSAPKDGIYELGGAKAGLRLIEQTSKAGMSPDTVLRAAHWGPGGRYGLTTSMEPTGFPAWLEHERERQHKSNREPEFLEFARRMEVEMPARLYYTAEQLAERDACSSRIIRELVAARRIDEMQTLAQAVGVANRKAPRP